MLLTIPEACAMIRVGRTKFYQLLNAGEIKAVKISKKTLVPKITIDEWIKSLPLYTLRKNQNMELQLKKFCKPLENLGRAINYNFKSRPIISLIKR